MIKHVEFDGENHPFLINIAGMELVMDELDINPFKVLQEGYGTPKNLHVLVYSGFRGGYLASGKECPFDYNDVGLKLTLADITVFSKLISGQLMKEKSNGQPVKKKQKA